MDLMDVIDKSMEVLRRYPLCDHCLGRLFALSGYGLENWERGRSIKDLIHMEMVGRVRLGDASAASMLRRLAESGHGPSARFLMDRMRENVGRAECPVCGGLFRLVDEAARAVASAMEACGVEFSSFQVGTTLPRQVLEADFRLSMEAATTSSESIKRELNRLIGKRVQALTGKEFSRSPDVVAVVSLPSVSVSLLVMPVYAAGHYRKLLRGPMPLGEVAAAAGAKSAIIHSPLRDGDARVLGEERMVLQLNSPRSRSIPGLGLIGFLELMELSRASRSDVEELKGEIDRERTYRGLVLFREPPSEDSLRSVSEFMEGRRVKQGRRSKLIKFMRLKSLGGRVAELLLRGEGGVSVEGLVDGIGVSPSISGVLGVGAKLVQLDVLDA
ncbi:tRNA pseudouridine(54/55) synthase Pus10 [Thermocladium modestius]|uniref:tRNA pseudouridine(54/55) synthase Pus10 n=2 Tax=Thermocladium modestius TaxID=62609 RepID=A0A830GYD8_9CREN|nr:tRNA pseudouridine(54/55) synthase Pus10 [Thermocladium modestius]